MSDDWLPTSALNPDFTVTIDVRSVTTYRWQPYKPEGARQMKAKGRWQVATEYGWENATLPNGEWRPNVEKVTK